MKQLWIHIAECKNDQCPVSALLSRLLYNAFLCSSSARFFGFGGVFCCVSNRLYRVLRVRLMLGVGIIIDVSLSSPSRSLVSVHLETSRIPLSFISFCRSGVIVISHWVIWCYFLSSYREKLPISKIIKRSSSLLCFPSSPTPPPRHALIARSLSQTPHCVTSRFVLTHYHRCNDGKCAVCAPVREMIVKSHERHRARSLGTADL